MEKWQEKLFNISLMKKDKVKLLSKLLDFKDKKICDIGCKGGTVSYFLKKNGGSWIHTDLEIPNLISAKSILKDGIFMCSENALPLKNSSFDIVLALDYLEHIDDDKTILKEIMRILKPGGTVVISTPITGKFFILNYIKKIFGLTPEIYGHKREGYRVADLKKMCSEENFIVKKAKTYSKFFVELVETSLNIMYIKMNKTKKSELKTGAISPNSGEDLEKKSSLYKIYSNFIYPPVYLFTRLDKLLWFKTGYATLIVCEKPVNADS